MTYIIAETLLEWDIWFDIIFLWGLYKQHKSHFLFLTLISIKRYSTLYGNLCSVNKLEGTPSFTWRRIPPPIEQWLNLYGLENPSNKESVVRKESSSFVSYTNKTSTLLIICDARNWNLFLIVFMLICAKMEWFKFSSLNDFRLTFGDLPFSLSFSICLLERLHF